MGDVQREYSGWLNVRISSTQRQQLERLGRSAGLELDIGAEYVEFNYQGRDSNRFVVEFLVGVANIIGTAEGEIRCDIESEDGDPVFEFYRVVDGRLVRWRGQVQRGPAETVDGF